MRDPRTDNREQCSECKGELGSPCKLCDGQGYIEESETAFYNSCDKADNFNKAQKEN